MTLELLEQPPQQDASVFVAIVVLLGFLSLLVLFAVLLLVSSFSPPSHNHGRCACLSVPLSVQPSMDFFFLNSTAGARVAHPDKQTRNEIHSSVQSKTNLWLHNQYQTRPSLGL